MKLFHYLTEDTALTSKRTLVLAMQKSECILLRVASSGFGTQLAGRSVKEDGAGVRDDNWVSSLGRWIDNDSM